MARAGVLVAARAIAGSILWAAATATAIATATEMGPEGMAAPQPESAAPWGDDEFEVGDESAGELAREFDEGAIAEFIEEPITSVAQLADVEPTDWAFQALQNLVERYGCLSGYPDRAFRGDRALTRDEFAAGLAACLAALGDRLTAETGDRLQKEDLLAIQRLQGEFGGELAGAIAAIDGLEERTQTLTDQQFSATTVMGGEVIFALAAAAGGDDGPGAGDPQATFSHLTRLQLVSSFTGRDRLRVQLSASNFEGGGFADPDALGTDMARLSYQGDTQNKFALDLVDYRFAALGDRAVFIVRPVGFDLSSVLTANSGFFDTGRGAISRFAEASPLFKIGALDAGFGADFLLGDRVRLQMAYGTGNSADPDQGIVGSDRSAAGVQLLLKPAETLLVGLAYLNAYADNGHLNTFTGSLNADLSGDRNAPATSHAVSGTVQWRLSPQVTLGAWGGWVLTDYIDSDAYASASTYAGSIAWSDPFGREGDLLALIVGQPLRLNGGRDVQRDRDTAFHIETFYRFRLSDRLSLTPGVFVVLNPEHDGDNDAIVVGTLRTTFRF